MIIPPAHQFNWTSPSRPLRAGLRPDAIPLETAMWGSCAWEHCRVEGRIPAGARWMLCPAHTELAAQLTNEVTALQARGLAPLNSRVPNAVFKHTAITTVRGPKHVPHFGTESTDGFAMEQPGNVRWVLAWAAALANYYPEMRKATDKDQAAKWVRRALQACLRKPELLNGVHALMNLGCTPEAFVEFATRYGAEDLLL